MIQVRTEARKECRVQQQLHLMPIDYLCVCVWGGGGGQLVTQLCPTLCDPMDLARQAPLSMGMSRQEYWIGLPCPPPGDLPIPGIEPVCPALAGRLFFAEPPGKPSSA